MATKFDATQIAAQILAGVDVDKLVVVTEDTGAKELQAKQAKPGSGEQAGTLTPPTQSGPAFNAEGQGVVTSNKIGTKTEGADDEEDPEKKGLKKVEEDADKLPEPNGPGAGKNDDGSKPVNEAADEPKPSEDDEKKDKEADKEMWDKVNKKVTESFSRIFTGSDLSTDFQNEMKTLFVASVTEAANHYKGVFVTKSKENAKKLAASAVKNVTEAVEKRADAYLQHTVTEWAQKNSAALKTNARTVVMESLMASMLKVFSDHNLTLQSGPNATPITKALAVSVTESASLADDAIKSQFKLAQENAQLKRELVLATESKKLTDVQAANLRTLTESASFADEASFRKNVVLIRDRLVTTGQAPAAPAPTTLKLVTESVDPAQLGLPTTAPSAPATSDFQAAILKLGSGN